MEPKFTMRFVSVIGSTLHHHLRTWRLIPRDDLPPKKNILKKPSGRRSRLDTNHPTDWFQWKKKHGFVPTLLSPSFWEVMFHLLRPGRLGSMFHETNFQMFSRKMSVNMNVDSRSSSGSWLTCFFFEIQKGQKQKWWNWDYITLTLMTIICEIKCQMIWMLSVRKDFLIFFAHQGLTNRFCQRSWSRSPHIASVDTDSTDSTWETARSCFSAAEIQKPWECNKNGLVDFLGDYTY